MKTWRVKITAKITKTYEVHANTRDEAIEEAHCAFSVLEDGTPEDYNQETETITEVETQIE